MPETTKKKNNSGVLLRTVATAALVASTAGCEVVGNVAQSLFWASQERQANAAPLRIAIVKPTLAPEVSNYVENLYAKEFGGSKSTIRGIISADTSDKLNLCDTVAQAEGVYDAAPKLTRMFQANNIDAGMTLADAFKKMFAQSQKGQTMAENAPQSPI